MGTTLTYRRGMLAHERIWVSFYRGDLALRAARRGRIPASRMPEALKGRLSERSNGQKLLDGGRMVASAIIDRAKGSYGPQSPNAAYSSQAVAKRLTT